MFIDELKKLEFLEGNDCFTDGITIKKISKQIEIYLVFDHVLTIEEYNKVQVKAIEILQPLGCKLNLNIGYKNEEISDADLLNYLRYILDDLSRKSARYKVFSADDAKIEDNVIKFLVANDCMGIEGYLPDLKKEFENYGLNINFGLLKDENRSIKKEIDQLNDKIRVELERQQKEAYEASKFNEIGKQKSYYTKVEEISKIKDIPTNTEQLQQHMSEFGQNKYMIEGYVFKVDFLETRNKKTVVTMSVTDETDSIICKKWLGSPEEKERYKKDITNDTMVKVTGRAEFDTYAKQVVIMASTVEITGKHTESIIMDEALEKRVELHAHTKYSPLDGLVSTDEYMNVMKKWGHKALAITDRSGLHAIPEIDHMIGGFPDFKPIYGVELAYIDDSKYFITFNKRDINLKTASYVVFDLETTGLSNTYDHIIEIAAHKVFQGGIIETFECFVNPHVSLSEKIVSLTSITDADLKDAESIETVLPRFLDFCKGSILVAHNASFDVSMIYANAKRLGIECEDFPVIDTLNLFRAGYYDKVKAFNLKQLSSYFKVKQEHHHRATDDTRVTALCFVGMLEDLYKRGITNYQDINSLINPEEHFKHIIPATITLLAKNSVGYKNLIKLTSDALTTHLASQAVALRSKIEELREGLLVGSGCDDGNVFEFAFRRSEDEVREEMKFCDYIEILPPSGYAHLYDSVDGGMDSVLDTIKRIIKIAKEMGKPVCAVGDVRYLRPNDKKYREILISSPQIGGGQHRLARASLTPSVHLRTTEEMLDEFSFLGDDLAREIVITNTNLVADMIEKYPAFKSETFTPADDEFKDNFLHIESISEECRKIVGDTLRDRYGDNPHPIIKNRADKELNAVINSGYYSVYYISHLLVKKSLSEGYIVGSRGSVGSSFVATLMGVTEINPLPPHYVCPKCKFHVLKMNEEEKEKYPLTDNEKLFEEDLKKVDSGYDLPVRKCPVCGTVMKKDGHDIPFETFLGFNGDKEPDIDLNFSGEYQSTAHEYIRTVFGKDYAFRAGTVATMADKTAYGYVKGYCERKGITLRECEIDRLSTKLVGIKRSTGQHPAGIVVVPKRIDIFDVTPIQYPADDSTSTWYTTQYDYHKFEKNLLKFDILGHDDPTLIKYLMDYVHAHQDDFTFSKAEDIPVDDPNVYRLFSETSVINVEEDDLGSKVASYAVPEFGTNFVRNMLVETRPKTFSELVKISGLSHGTDVWNNNAQELINGRTPYGKIAFEDIIGCRDDIMVYLSYQGLEPAMAFKIMEFVRKNKKADDPNKWLEYKDYMKSKGVPEWYIWSCEKILYMFPKAHATAYVLMALRIAWFKVYAPIAFYSAWLSKRAKAHEVQTYLSPIFTIKDRLEELANKNDRNGKEDDLITTLQVVLEMRLRGFEFLPVDINLSDSTSFIVEEGKLRIPFVAVDRLGENAAIDVVERRNERAFSSKADVKKRTKINSTVFDDLLLMHALDALPDEDKEKTEGIFAFA